MERLTKKNETNALSYSEEEKTQAIIKLSKYEDLEEQIGCPLEVALSTSEVEVVQNNEICKSQIMGVNNHAKSIMIGSSYSYSEFPLSLYGKTWWKYWKQN